MAIRPYIGYPNELFNNTEIENFYSGVSLQQSEMSTKPIPIILTTFFS